MANASLRAQVLVLAAGLLSAANAAADERAGAGADRTSISEPPAPGRSQEWMDVVPKHCAPFATIFTGSADRPDSEHAWRQLLSFAACVQDGSVGKASDLDQLEAMVEDMSRRIAMPMLVYLDALENGDASIQLRAAFQIGMTYVAFSTRARSAIVAPPDLATNDAAASRYHELHARLEPLLVPARRAAWISFHAIDEAAAQNAELAGDELERTMICTARRMLPLLRDAAPERRLLVVEPPSCERAPITAAAP